MAKFSHMDKANRPSMVDISGKEVGHRTARAQCRVQLNREIFALFRDGDIQNKKGPVFQTAILAGVMAAKKTSDLIPLCHPLPLSDCQVKIKQDVDFHLVIDCFVSTDYKTGVEMEALTGVSVAALTLYDMCKSLSHDIRILETRLISKTGGKSDFRAEA